MIEHKIRELLVYDPETGIFTWKSDRRVNAVKKGDRAGCLKRGYRIIQISGEQFHAARLAWFFVNGKWPSAQVDHANLDRGDDRWANLRHATNSKNQANTRLRKDNVSGHKGIYWNKKASRWHASLGLNSKVIHLLSTPDKAEAAIWYRAFHELAFGEFSRA